MFDSYGNGGMFDYGNVQAGDPGYMDIGNTISTGSQIGSTIGSVIPGAGTAIGAGVGALAGGALALGERVGEIDNKFLRFGASVATGGIGMIGQIIGKKKRERAAREAEKQAARVKEQKDDYFTSMADMGTLSNSNIPMAMGGYMDSYSSGGTFNPVGHMTEFTTGGSHESNPNGGIPQGYNSQGQLRMVEEGELKLKLEEGDYVFSDRLMY